MSITHHPSDATPAGFASRSFDEGMSLLVATHLSFCRQCRGAVRAFEHVGGALLDEVEPVPLRADALPRAIARIQRDKSDDSGNQRKFAMRDFPAPISQYTLGPWRWIARGLHWRSVSVPDGQGSRVFMLKAASGTGVPDPRHAGVEWTCVLEGAFRHNLDWYGPGVLVTDDRGNEVARMPLNPLIRLLH
jgi:putative transcriptional regulator